MEEAGVSSLCRMCMDILHGASECYSIDENLGTLISTLTGILVDLNIYRMCTSCVSILNRFNETRLTWIENQEKFENELIKNESNNDETSINELQHTEEDSQVEYEYSFEYLDEQELEETEMSTSESAGIEEIPEIEESKKSTRLRSKKSATAYKGKEVYQKLLQECPDCSKMIEKNRMEGHINKHRNLRPYVCEAENCGKTFFCKLLLRLHRTSIHTDQIIECKICSKTFKSERSLYTHNLRHKNENRYECTYCDRKFNNNNSLCRHLAIHSGVREFSCQECSASFYRKFNLDTHIRTVHNKDKSYACSFCPKKFGYARLLREHTRKNHTEVIEDQGIFRDTTADES